MKILRRIFRNPFIWLLLLTGIYFISRITNLTVLPIFTDEAIYIRWSQIGATDAAWRFISLTDGKQPLFTWFVMAALRIFKDPLFAGRIVSVFSGFFGMIGLFFLGREVFKSDRIGVIASALYVISPFPLMYDRMAMYDALVAMCSIWNLYLAILLVRRVRLDIALIFGITLGFGMLNKTSSFFSLYLLPATIVLFDFHHKEWKKRLALWMAYCLIAAGLSQIIYSVLRLSPFFYIISQKDALFVYPFREWLTHPFHFLVGNLHGVFDWAINYLTWPIFVAAILPCLWIVKKPWEKLLLLGWWFAPFFALALFGKVLYPRFILFMVMPLFVLAAYFMDWLMKAVKKPLLSVALVVIICIPSIYTSYAVVTDITHAPIPKSDIGQYINDWPSGWGVNEVVSYINGVSQQGPVAVYTEGTFGLFPYALEIYLHTNSNVEIHGIWPPPKTIPEDIATSASVKPTYYVTYQPQEIPTWPLTLIASYQKGSSKTAIPMRLYKVNLPKAP